MPWTARSTRLRRVAAPVALATTAAACAVAFAARPVTDEIRVNTTTAGYQEDPPVAMDADGNFAVAWETPDADLDGIVLRRFSASGSPLTDELSVNASPAGDQDDPAISSARNGDLAVAWDVADEAVKARVFPLEGRRSEEIDVNVRTGDIHESAAIAADADGDFVVAWASTDAGGDSGVMARTFDRTGTPRGSGEISVNTTTAGDQDQATVAIDDDGDFVVAWESFDQDGDGEGVFARRFNAAGRAQGGEIPVTATVADDQLLPAVAMGPYGDFVVAWEGSDLDGTGIVARRFDAAGSPAGQELAVNETTAWDQLRPAVDMAADGSFVVGWEGNGAGDADGVFVREFTAAGVPASGEEPVNTTTTFFQERAGVASDANGGFVVSWQGEESDLAGFDVFARRFARPPTTGGGRQPVIRRLRLSRSRRGRAIRVTVECVSEVCRVRGAGVASVPRAGARRRFRLRADREVLRRGPRGRLRLRLSPRTLRAAIRGSGGRRWGRRVRVRVFVVGRDAAGGRTALRGSIRVRPRVGRARPR